MYLRDFGEEPSVGNLHFSTYLEAKRLEIWSGELRKKKLLIELYILGCWAIPVLSIPFIHWIYLSFLWNLGKEVGMKCTTKNPQRKDANLKNNICRPAVSTFWSKWYIPLSYKTKILQPSHWRTKILYIYIGNFVGE